MKQFSASCEITGNLSKQAQPYSVYLVYKCMLTLCISNASFNGLVLPCDVTEGGSEPDTTATVPAASAMPATTSTPQQSGDMTSSSGNASTH